MIVLRQPGRDDYIGFEKIADDEVEVYVGDWAGIECSFRMAPGMVQQLVDALAELFPDVKPSPPLPKVGDRVRTSECHVGDVRAVDAGWVWVRLDDHQGADDAPWIYRSHELTVVERGES